MLDRQEEITPDEPPSYEAPPDYEEVIKIGMEQEMRQHMDRPRRHHRHRRRREREHCDRERSCSRAPSNATVQSSVPIHCHCAEERPTTSAAAAAATATAPVEALSHEKPTENAIAGNSNQSVSQEITQRLETNAENCGKLKLISIHHPTIIKISCYSPFPYSSTCAYIFLFTLSILTAIKMRVYRCYRHVSGVRSVDVDKQRWLQQVQALQKGT